MMTSASDHVLVIQNLATSRTNVLHPIVNSFVQKSHRMTTGDVVPSGRLSG